MNVLIPRNSTIPLKAGEMFTTAVDNQCSMLIHVLQGERERAKNNWSIGKFTIEFESAPHGVPRVGVQFEIDANGILHVLARDTKTGKEKIVEMNSAVDVDDSAVQKMVEESVEHAFTDLTARRWIEAKLRSNETLAATRKAITDCGNEIEGDYREKIESAAREVGKILAEENPESGSGDFKKLQLAVALLDETTKPLADLLMDKAMEAMLKKRGLIR
jgi:molecular chaperone DnaK